jgi:putative endonuclease
MVKCSDGCLYTGCTTNLTRRVRQHNGDLAGGAKYTASRRPVTLVAAVSAPSRSAAQIEESRLKRLKRDMKLLWCKEHAWKGN